MKKISIILLFALIPVFIFAQKTWEPSVFVGSGYMTDNGGNGAYVYGQFGGAKKIASHRVGAFVNMVVVDVEFNQYRYRAQEFAPGFSYDAWGKISKNYSFSFWFNPSIKLFSDHGQNGANGEEAWQKDVGCYLVSGANINDSLNRWFHSYKLQLQFQQPFWSKRTGLWLDESGYLSDDVNFKAVNKSYVKAQLESTVKKISSGKLKIEPKLVVAYLYDGASQNSMYEGGCGLAFSFIKGERYFEIGNIQYRARFGKEMKNRLDLIELNFDLVNFYRLLR